MKPAPQPTPTLRSWANDQDAGGEDEREQSERQEEKQATRSRKPSEQNASEGASDQLGQMQSGPGNQASRMLQKERVISWVKCNQVQETKRAECFRRSE